MRDLFAKIKYWFIDLPFWLQNVILVVVMSLIGFPLGFILAKIS